MSDDNTKGPPKQLDRIKSSAFARGLSLARLSVNAGASLAGQGLARLWDNKDLKDQKWKDFLTVQAQALSNELGQLKGSLMKAGQTLSMYGEHFFPPEVNHFLKSLQHDSPPVKWEQIHRTLLKELGPERLALLEIETESLASASLGQVHRARIKATGEQIVLKIQYPGVEKAIDSDLKGIRTFLTLLKLLPKDLNVDPLFSEVRDMLVQETNYELEAELTTRYAENLSGDERFVVPRVHPEFSNRHILATSFEQGVRADDPLVQALAPERRNRLAENFLELYFKEIFEWSFVQTDPHAGNYRIRISPDGNDQIVLLDFGATRQYSTEFITAYRRLIEAAVLGQQERFHEAAHDLQFLSENDDPRLKKVFEDFCMMIVEPFRAEVYDWKNTDLPQRTTGKALEILRGFHWRTPPREIIFLDRKSGGVFIMLSILRARIHGRALIMKYLDAGITAKTPNK